MKYRPARRLRPKPRRKWGLPLRARTPIDHVRSTLKFIARVQADLANWRTLRAAAVVDLNLIDREIERNEENITEARGDLKQNRKDARNCRKRLARAAARRSS